MVRALRYVASGSVPPPPAHSAPNSAPNSEPPSPGGSARRRAGRSPGSKDHKEKEKAPPPPQPTAAERLAFINETRTAFGRTALLLSGGAAFGFKHVGVLKVTLPSYHPYQARGRPKRRCTTS